MRQITAKIANAIANNSRVSREQIKVGGPPTLVYRYTFSLLKINYWETSSMALDHFTQLHWPWVNVPTNGW